MIHIQVCSVHNWTFTYIYIRAHVCVRRDTAYHRLRSFRLSNRPVCPYLGFRSFASPFKSTPSWKRIQYAPGKRNMFDDDGERVSRPQLPDDGDASSCARRRVSSGVNRIFIFTRFSLPATFDSFSPIVCAAQWTAERRNHQLRFLAFSAVKSKQYSVPYGCLRNRIPSPRVPGAKLDT